MRKELAFETELECDLSEKKFKIVFESLNNPDNDAYIKANVWNIISTVCLTVKTKELVQDENELDICKKILLNLVDRGNPKEVIVALMEDADSFKNHFHFCLLLDPLKLALEKVPGKRGRSLEWVLSTLNAHIQTLPLPRDLDLEGEELLLLDTDPAVIDTNYILKNYLQFVDAFVNEVSFEAVRVMEDYYTDRIEHQQEILQKYILILFDHPLLYHDLHVVDDTKPKSTIRTLCESYVKSLSKICGNVFNLFKFDSSFIRKKAESDDSDVVPILAFSNLAYLMFVENIAIDFQPFVYNHKYVFMTILKYIIPFLSKQENLVLFKSLHLAKILLDRLDPFEISYNYVEMEGFTKFSELLLSVAILSSFNRHRKMAIDVFKSYIDKCDWKGRYHLINQVLCTAGDSGAEGFVIDMYKSYLNELLQEKVTDHYFLGKNLKLFLKKIFTIKDGVETDLLQDRDRIIASLNFLRYLVIRDKTLVQDFIDDIKGKFLDPMVKGLDISKAHFKLEAENTKKTRSVYKEAFESALLNLDLMGSILYRVIELI
ncbi:hypothetical protein CEXT_175031 [Caerostris extrusa]|uniref:Glomulin n=1 Tax=Caerostris extrusa TaxID=172846 RepID=A0AAV4UY54_CAEEX|nr:hypothetical protein CEXT_175031 [Caerostris extrusa]